MALFRYPGGKAKYSKWILPNLFRCSGFSLYVEPFVGGGSVALAVAKQYPSVKLILNDLDPGIAAFWDLVATAADVELKALADRISSTHPTVDLFFEIKNTQPTNRLERAFRSFFLNRTSWGGMGKRPLGGKKQASKDKIHSRWGAKNLVCELFGARKLLYGRTKVYNDDFAKVIPLAQAGSMMFLDPPYYEAGNSLYKFVWSDADHVRLRDALAHMNNWVMSYDDHKRIRELYGTLATVMSVKYSLGSGRKKMNELLLSTRLEFPTDTNPDVGIGGISDTLRIWVEGYGPED